MEKLYEELSSQIYRFEKMNLSDYVIYKIKNVYLIYILFFSKNLTKKYLNEKSKYV